MSTWAKFIDYSKASINQDYELVYQNSSNPSNIPKYNFFTDGYYDGTIEVSGKDATQFLHNLLTIDVTNLNNKSLLAAFCTPKGNVITNVQISKIKDVYILRMPRDMLTTTISHMKKYIILFQVNISDMSSSYISINIFTDDLKKIFSDDIFENLQVNQTIFYNNCIFQIKKADPISIEILSKNIGAIKQYWSALLNSDLKLISNKSAKLFLLDQKLVRISPNITEKHTPNHLNYEKFSGISYSKGCYIGQEIIARIKHLTTLKTNLQVISFSNSHPSLSDGMAIYNQENKQIATILNVVKLPDKSYRALIISKYTDIDLMYINFVNTV